MRSRTVVSSSGLPGGPVGPERSEVVQTTTLGMRCQDRMFHWAMVVLACWMVTCSLPPPRTVASSPQGWQGDTLMVVPPNEDAPDLGPIRETVRDALIDHEDKFDLFSCPGRHNEQTYLLFDVNADGSAPVVCVASERRSTPDRPVDGFALPCRYVASDIGGWCRYTATPEHSGSDGCRCLVERFGAMRLQHAPPGTKVLALFVRGLRDPYAQRSRAFRFR